MQRKNWLHVYAWTGLIITLLLCFLLVAFLSIWTVFSEPNLMSQAGLQRARGQRLAKDVLILSSHPTDEQRAQAINEIQITLPGWQQTQEGLRNGDSKLGLPRRVPEDIALIMNQAQSDYVAMITATKTILAHPEPVDETQVAIVLSHERNYFLLMSQVNTLWQQHLEESSQQIFWYESGIVGVIAVLVSVEHIFITWRALKLLTKAKEREDANN